MPRAALFDMDRTLVRKQTASLYVRYQRDLGEASVWDSARVLLWVAKYTAGMIDAPEIASRAARSLAGVPEVTMEARCDDWFSRYVEAHVAERGRLAVEAHRARGDVLAIVTGAPSYSARPLGKRLGIDHIVASELEVDDGGHFTGKLVLPLCYGEGKIERTLVLADRLGFDLRQATFYSDSYTDLPLLEYVHAPVAVNPDPRLARFAKRRGWRVERW